MFDVFETTFTF